MVNAKLIAAPSGPADPFGADPGRRRAHESRGDQAGSDAKLGVGVRCSLRPVMSTVNNPGPAFPPWPGPGKDAILQPPKPDMTPSPQVLERAVGRDADREAAD